MKSGWLPSAREAKASACAPCGPDGTPSILAPAARQSPATVRPRGTDRCNVDDRVRVWRRHAGEAAKLRNGHKSIRHVLVEEAMVDAGGRLDPAVGLAVVKHVVGGAAIASGRV